MTSQDPLDMPLCVSIEQGSAVCVCVCVSTCMVDGCLRVVVVSGKYLNVFVNNYCSEETQQRTCLQTGTEWVRERNRYGTDTEWILNSHRMNREW